MKRFHWLSLLILVGLFVTPAWPQTGDSGSIPGIEQQKTKKKKHARHHHHRGAHKGHIDRDRYPQG